MLEQLEHSLEAASSAAPTTADSTPQERSGWLHAIADDLDAATDELVDLAAAETHLPTGRLTGEVRRTTFQLRLLAGAVTEGSWLEACIDHADPNWPMGARPDLRRFLRALGPVLVVAASNFPFAFSVAGGDTAAALGVGCPVLVKAHPGHLALSRRTATIVTGALSRAGAPAGAFTLIEGEEVARAALTDPRVKAGAFTGSVNGGRALYDLACQRPDPIPFYGELGSVNPAFLLPSAVEQRRTQVLKGFVASFTNNAGQFCTKPGVLFAPHTTELLKELTALVAAVPAAPMLNERIASGFGHRLTQMREEWQIVHDGQSTPGGVTPTLFAATLDQARAQPDALFEEAFGSAAILVEYTDPAELVDLASLLPGQLTVTVFGEPEDTMGSPLLAEITKHAGRIVWNEWPTGVSVTWAMHHGGGWPATTASTHTSVGPSGMRRFVSPVALQNMPPDLLPAAVRDSNPWRIWQRINGQLTDPHLSSQAVL